MPRTVIALRPFHGYSVTKHEASAAKTQKTLRRQFGHSYDQKKVCNISHLPLQFRLTCSTRSFTFANDHLSLPLPILESHNEHNTAQNGGWNIR